MTNIAMIFIVLAVVAGILFVLSGIRIVQEHERGIVLRQGRAIRNTNARLNWIIPGIDQLLKVDIRTLTIPIEREETVTRDSIVVKIDAVLSYRIVNPERAILSVADYRKALHKIALTALRSIVVQQVMDEVLKERDSISQKWQKLADDRTGLLGIKVEAIEIKNMQIPASLQRALEHKAEAERKIAEIRRQGPENF